MDAPVYGTAANTFLDDLQSYKSWVSGCASYLSHLIAKVVHVKKSLRYLPDEESRAVLQQMLPRCKQALSKEELLERLSCIAPIQPEAL